jgi:putative nucleotidyltransferase with HDIG domain
MATYCEVATVFQAVGALGIDRTRELSLTIATASYAHDTIQSESLQPWWRHTVASALIASELARQCGIRPEGQYTTALLHDIGRLGLFSVYRAKYEELVAAADGEDDLLRAERTAFGIDHVEAAVRLARQWKLPQALVEAIAHCHEAPRDGALHDAAVVHMACLLADSLGFAADRFASPMGFEAIAARLPDSTRSRLQARLPAVKSAILKEIGLSEKEENDAGGETNKEEASIGSAPAGEPPPVRSFRLSLAGVIVVVVVLLAAIVVLLRR